MNKHSIETKKSLGAFYTPSEATKILCDWAIQAPSDLVLEPSFGGCGFIEASIQRLASLGSSIPINNVFGCDIDDVAFQHLSAIVGPVSVAGKFLHTDFLKLNRSSFLVDKFNAIIGNPPYISSHNMSEEQKNAASVAIKAGGFTIEKKASLWAYFILHSLSFLAEKARMAWILPASFLNAEYSQNIKSILSKHFHNTLMLSLGERLFLSEGADESTVIVLCDKWSSHEIEGKTSYSHVESLQGFGNILKLWEAGAVASCERNIRPNLALLGNESTQYYNIIKNHKNTFRLGSQVNILIGIVTGANHFFVLNKSKADSHKLPTKHLTPIFSKFGLSSGIILDESSMHFAVEQDKKCLLVDTSKMTERDVELAEYLSLFPSDEILSNQTFKKRSTWHQPDDGRVPDAFLPYMIHSGPHLVLNEARVTSTNTIHRVYFNTDVTNIRSKLIAISVMSTFSQLSAEIEGRTYGSGVLKLEPKEAKKLLVHLPDNIPEAIVEDTIQFINKSLKSGNADDAQQAADAIILGSFKKTYGSDMFKALSDTLQKARLRRRKVIVAL